MQEVTRESSKEVNVYICYEIFTADVHAKKGIAPGQSPVFDD